MSVALFLFTLMLSLGSSGPEQNDLRISIARIETADSKPSNPQFAITLENHGDADFVLYAGDCAAIECANRGPDYYWNGIECVYAPGSPIVIATAQDAQYPLTSAEHGVQFDIDGDGAAEQIAWTEPDSDVTFLALDRDGDGFITSGRELFGNHTMSGVADGFSALARTNMETNGNVPRASVSSDDPLFAKLLLWRDRNHNGVSEPSELQPASAVLSDIGLGFELHHRQDGFGNEYRYRGWVHIRTAPGRNRAEEIPEQQARKRFVYDVFFRIQR